MLPTSVAECFLMGGDLTRIYRLNYWTYVFTGFWELESDKRWKTCLYRAYHSVVVFVYLFSVFSYLNDAMAVRYDLDKLSFNMSTNVLVLVTLLKVSLLKKQSPDVKKLLEKLENHLNMETMGRSVQDKEILQRRAKVILNIHRLLYGLLVASFGLRIMADTMFDGKVYLIPLPFEHDLKNHYVIIYAPQVIVGLHFLVTVMAHDLFIYGIMNRFIAHFEILEKNLVRLGQFCARVEDEGRRVVSRGESAATERRAGEMLKENIYHHQELLKEILNFTRIYSSSFIIQASAAVFITGIVAIKILFLSSQLTPLLIQQIMYLGINLINNLFLCSLGSELTSKSVAAADALYGVPWFEMGAENRRTVSIALEKLVAGAKLKGGGLVVINRRTYLKFLQTSYNMIMLLRNLYRS